MQMLDDFYKVAKVIRSCVDSRQNNHAFRLVQLFERKHSSARARPFADELYQLVDNNLGEIYDRSTIR